MPIRQQKTRPFNLIATSGGRLSELIHLRIRQLRDCRNGRRTLFQHLHFDLRITREIFAAQSLHSH